MRLPKADIHTETSDNIDKSFKFGIREQDTGLILDILRKKMYKDPIVAMCREISCNSKDAHVEIGTPEKPIEVILPTALNPELKIKDFGLGINQKRIANIFVNFGASTKRNSNKYIGAYGLGAKSAFAYGDSFTVVTICNKKKRTYTAYIDESQKGKLDLLREEATKEHTGTTIIIPIKKDDCTTVAQAIIEATAYWHVKPILKGSTNIPEYPDFGEPMLSDEKENWILFSSSNNRRSHRFNDKAKILIDRIGYDVSPKDLGIKYDPYSYSNEPKDKKAKALASLLEKDLHLEFGIGKLNLASNRDNIHFDNPTQKTIIDKLEKVLEALYDHAMEKIAKFDNIADAEKFWADFKEYIPAVSAGKTPSWKSIELKGLTRLINKNKDKDAPPASGVLIEHFYWYHKTIRKSYVQEWVVRKEVKLSLDLTHSVYINDLDTKLAPRARVVELMSSSRTNNDTGYKAISDDKKIINHVCVMTFNNPDTEVYWYDTLNLAHVKLKSASSLPIPDKTRKISSLKRKKRENFDAWKFNTRYDKNWEPCLIEKNGDKGTYVIIINKRNMKFDKMAPIRYHISELEKLRELLDEPIYGIHIRHQHFIGDEWEPLNKVGVEKIKEALKGFDIAETKYHAGAASFMYNEAFYESIRKAIKVNELGAESKVLRYIKKSKELKHLINECKFNQELYGHFKYIVTCKAKKIYDINKHPLNIMMNEIKKTYPLLIHLNNYNYTEIPSEAVMEYISMIDEKEKHSKIAQVA